MLLNQGHLLSRHPLAPVNHVFLCTGLNANVVGIAEEEDTSTFTFGFGTLLNELADTRSSEKSPDETPGATIGVGAVVLAQNLLNGLGGLVRVVEGDGGNEVVSNVGLNDAVKEVTANEAEFTVNSSGGSTNEIPGLRMIMGQGGVGVLEIGDGNCEK